MDNLKVGDRVRIVHRAEATGVVVGPAEPSSLDGGPRWPIRWDRTGAVSRWGIAFLVPANQPLDADPPVVDGPGGSRSVAAVCRRLDNDTWLMAPARFEKIPAQQSVCKGGE